ncbi:MAG: UvrD-helicase domain-containing protein [bacterium]|nr:UvrD-helicase domain-containing protein [bacterium]
MPYSEAQRAAIQTLDRNLLVVAGAGSGKTFVLVERFLYLLEQRPEWPLNALVAITFTQKAAGEMRNRVRRELERRANQPDLEMETRDLWLRHLAAMDSARIGTIHALCASILRANAAEAGIDPDFTVLDEVGAAILLESAVDSALGGLVRAADPAIALYDEYDARTIRSALMRAAPASVELPALPDDVLAFWQTAWTESAGLQLRRLRDDADFWAALAYQPQAGIPDGDKLANGWRDALDCGEILRTSDDLHACLNALTRIKALKINVGSKNAWGGQETLKAVKDCITLLRDRAEAVLALVGSPPGEVDQAAAALIPHWHRLIEAVKRTYADAKAAQSALDFDDLEARTRDLLTTYPSVRARYWGAEFKHLLVDEFQDTNARQWEIVNALADLDEGGRVFLVGDPKQSIYAFRGADVSVFEQVRADFRARPNAREIIMAESFRTHQRLIDGFNAWFAHVLRRETHSPVAPYQVNYDPLSASRTLDAEAPCVEWVLVDKGMLKGDADQEPQAARRWEARAVVERLRTIVETERWTVFDRETRQHRPIRYGDIALLFQAMTHAPLYEEALKAAGVRYVTVAGRGYYERQEVWDVLNLLRALYNPLDDLSLAAALRSPMFALSDEGLLALRLLDERAEKIPLWNALERAAADSGLLPGDDAAFAQYAWACLNELRQRVGRVSLAELLRAALDLTGYLAMLTGLPDGARRRGNVEKLIDKAAQSGSISLGAFALYLTDLSESETREGEAVLDAEGAVQLMTVHKSKGLEFPLVVLVDSSHRPRGADHTPVLIDPLVGMACKLSESAGDPESPDFEARAKPFAYRYSDKLRGMREEAERRRLLYVAVTRAQDYLIISGGYSAHKTEGIKAEGVLNWLFQAADLRQQAWEHEARIQAAWGTYRLHLPPQPNDDVAVRDAPFVDWNGLHSDEPISLAPVTPPLLADILRESDAPVRSLTATQIADLGAAFEALPNNQRPVFAERWRRAVLHNAPLHIERISDRSDRALRRRVGEIVHQLLCVRSPDDDPQSLKALIASYAWEYGIVDPTEREIVIKDSLAQFRRTAASDIHRWIAGAQQLYREVPFVFGTEKRVIHGVIDMLMQRDDGEWVIVDYKTSWIDRSPSAAQFIVHATRFTLQVGVYAAAVNELIGVVPRTFIHYIRYNYTVEIPEKQWRGVLDKLERYIGDLMGIG